jgi:Type II CAAX prenyl endopeptidase Rce1-like
MSRYLEATRRPTYSLLFALPLLVLYEAGAAMIADDRSGGMRNGADVLLRTMLAAGGLHGTLALTAVLALVAAVLIVRDQRKSRTKLEGSFFAGMMAESTVYAVLFGFVVSGMTSLVLNNVRLSAGGGLTTLPFFDAVVLSLGAGIYEELVFRVLLVGGLLALFAAMGASRRAAAIYSALLAALLFSAFHYVGPYAYPLELQSFTFRFLAGLAFSVLFILRGFGVAAWTHALYDVFLVVLRGGEGG